MSADILAKVVFELRRLKNEFAHAAVASPQNRDAFEYGRVAGHYAGLAQAEAVIDQIFRESTEVIEHDGNIRRDASSAYD